ncbi:MAG TPA: SigE family RNA polymerase sigma factor [Acidimicrobiales bacterium]
MVSDGETTVVSDGEHGDRGPDDFCRAIHPRLVGSLRLYLGEPELAEELAQDALVRVVERWTQVSAMDGPEAWTYRVAFNLARSVLRRRIAERRARSRSERRPTSSWNVDVAEVLSVRAAIAALPARQRQAVVLRYYGDLTLDQVAEAMGCRLGTVKAHLHQAHASLRLAPLLAADPTAPAVRLAPGEA